MKIEAIKAALPSRRVSNNELIALVREHSQGVFDGDLEAALKQIGFYLRYAGSDERRWLGPGETPIGLLCRATEQALDEAGLRREDIDLLIYTGIGRGFLEPGGAYHAAAALGMDRVQCFDVIDACMSWTRALQLSRSLFGSGDDRRALIINAEFNMLDGGAINPGVLRLPDAAAIEWSFPAFTLGEAASATIVSADDEREWRFAFESRPEFSDLCNIPIHGYEGFCRPSPRIGRNGVGRFTSFGFDLIKNGAPVLLSTFEKLHVRLDEVKAVFPHASSKRDWDILAKEAGIQSLMHFIYPDTGNLASASVPTGIATAIEAGKVKRGDRIVGWVGSAGMSFCAYTFVY